MQWKQNEDNVSKVSGNAGAGDTEQTQPLLEAMWVSASVDENLKLLSSVLGSGIGLNEGKFKALGGAAEAGVVYIESICDKESINKYVIAPLLNNSLTQNTSDYDISTLVQTKYILTTNTKKVSKMKDIVDEILLGNTAVFLENSCSALIVPSRKVEKRNIDKPENETTILASRESFTEDIESNINLILKRMPVPELHFEEFTLGNLSKTVIKLMWLDGVANSDVITEAKNRLGNVDLDMIDNIGILAEIIRDNPIGVFPTYRQTERPDTTAKEVSIGRFAILCDNSAFALVGPISFWDSFKTMDDYSEPPFAATLLRIVRFIAFVIATTISPMYLSFVTYNQPIVPPSLALNISSGREGVPFPSVIELLAMTVIIEIIREAGVRMPGMVGYFIGTIGAVIIGQTAVSAGYVSVSVIIVVAFSAIASFAISSTLMVNAARLINYFLILLSGFLGMFGLLNGIFIVIWRMVTLESFGIPYLYPVVPYEFQGWKDTFIRAPFKALKEQLTLLTAKKNKKCESKNKK